MKKLVTLLALFCILCSGRLSAQSNGLTISDSVAQLTQFAANLQDSVSSAAAATRQLRDAMNGGTLILDTSAVQYLQAHPDSLYKRSFYKPVNRMGSNGTASWIRYILCMGLLLGVWYYGYTKFTTSSMCRDVCYDASGNLKPYQQSPYSFSRVQLFWWTMIILTCYIYLYAVTGVLAPVNATIGILLGFSVTVYAGARIIDKKQVATNPPNTRSQDTAGKSDGLLTDIMSDETGISIHRFQTVIFTVVFGFGFMFYFINGMQGGIYPFQDFSTWQFGLLGISSAAYLGIKSQENGSPAATQQGAAGGGAAMAGYNAAGIMPTLGGIPAQPQGYTPAVTTATTDPETQMPQAGVTPPSAN